MNNYRSSAELKASAKEHMFGHYGTAIGAYLLVTFGTGIFTLMVLSLTGDTSTFIGTCIYIATSFALSLLAGLFTSGVSYFYLKIVCNQHVTTGDVFYGFKFYPDKALRIQAWITLITYIGSIPEYIMIYRMPAHPGTEDMIPYLLCSLLSGLVTLILNLFYGQAFFLLHDFPQYSAGELLAASRKVMRGQKHRLFYIYISFIPLLLLSILSCGIAMLWITPYMNATLTEFYFDLVQKRQ
ncbi:MAG: DUF975 family protein [Lachnospiraceae bacterium]|nr:DUF975 family protein [Lachnospiraceae bacterium]